MRALKVGEVRVILDHVTYYMPVGNDAGEGGKPAISLKLIDSPTPLLVAFSTEQKRDARMRELDDLFLSAAHAALAPQPEK